MKLDGFKLGPDAKFLLTGWAFALLPALGLGWMDVVRGRGTLAVVPVLALVYSIPFVCVLGWWRLWLAVGKPNLNERQVQLCLIGVWAIILPVYADLIFVLPFEHSSPATMRVLAPLMLGILFSPAWTTLGALAGVFGYWLGWRTIRAKPVMQVVFTMATVVLEIAVLPLIAWATGLVGIVIVVAIVMIAAVGATVARRAERRSA